MTPLRFWSQSKKAEWLARQDARLRAQYAPQLARIESECHSATASLQTKREDLQRLQRQLVLEEEDLIQRRVKAEQANTALREQLKLLEAKAAPDRVWVEAFSRGYQTAWDTIWPLMSAGVTGIRNLIEQQAIEATLARMNDTIVQKAQALGQTQARTILELREKQTLFQQKRLQAETQRDRMAMQKYDYYLEALDWMLNANGVHPHQPAAE